MDTALTDSTVGVKAYVSTPLVIVDEDYGGRQTASLSTEACDAIVNGLRDRPGSYRKPFHAPGSTGAAEAKTLSDRANAEENIRWIAFHGGKNDELRRLAKQYSASPGAPSRGKCPSHTWQHHRLPSTSLALPCLHAKCKHGTRVSRYKCAVACKHATCKM